MAHIELSYRKRGVIGTQNGIKMIKTEEKITIVCDMCNQSINEVRYIEVRIKDDKLFHLHWNCHLSLMLSLPFVRKTGITTGFNFEERENKPNHLSC